MNQPITGDELLNFFKTLDDYAPTLPDSLTAHYLSQAGLHTSDPRIVSRLLGGYHELNLDVFYVFASPNAKISSLNQLLISGYFCSQLLHLFPHLTDISISDQTGVASCTEVHHRSGIRCADSLSDAGQPCR